MGRHYEFERPDLTTIHVTLDSRHKLSRIRYGNEPMWATFERFINEHKKNLELEELVIKLQKTIAHQHEIIQQHKHDTQQQETLLTFMDNDNNSYE